MPVRPPEERLKVLTDAASQVEVINGLNIQQYFRAMRSMLLMLETHAKAKHIEKAYMLATKFVILFLKRLPRHREYSSIDANDKAVWTRRCKVVLELAEEFKEELRSKYENEYRIDQEELSKARKVAAAVDRPPSDLTIDDAPTVPDSIAAQTPTSILLPDQGPLAPPIDRSLKPKPSVAHYGWSPVRIPSSLMERFVELARPNTNVDKETCGSLCARIVDHEYIITDLVIPKQYGTPNSCVTHNEEELFDYMERKALIVVGWIHTHPTQTAFLSSVDQHSQLSYQLMLPEAIAIVCAPKYADNKIFSLTPNYGISTVLNCNLDGFHPHHREADIFEVSRHVVLDVNLALVVADLR